MRALKSCLLLGAMGAVLLPSELAACGDKYLRFANRLGPAYTAEHGATVLIYMPRDSAARKPAGVVRPALERAGHRVYVVEQPADLETTLTQRTYDVVLAAEDVVPQVQARLGNGMGRPSLVPIVHSGSKPGIAAKRKQIGCLISTQERSYYAAAEIDHVMELRKAARANP